MHLKSLLGGIAIAATVAGSAAGAQPTPVQSKARAKAPEAAASYKKELPRKLALKATIAEAVAAATALAKVPGGKIESVELEEEGGKLIYSYDIKIAGKKGIEEIQVDAMSGAVVKAEHESPAAMNAEAEKDAKEAKVSKMPLKGKVPPPVVKKP
jgi:uncharacterized membrane protein YkoI